MKVIVRIAASVAALATLAIVTLFVVVRQPSLIRSPDRLHARAVSMRMQRDVEFLTTHYVPRSADHPENLAGIADHLAAEFSRSGATVSRQRFHARGHEYQNVIASFGNGAEPALIIGAHYDVFSEHAALPGADDNASGVAALLELSRLLALQKPERRVDLVAYANEEPPFFGSDQMGSAVHASSLARPARPPMISLEMIGYFTDVQPASGSLLDWFVPKRGDFVVIAGRWSDRRLSRKVRAAFNAASPLAQAYSLIVPRSLGIDASDHASYWDRGFEAVLITDTAYIRNPHYHTANDTFEKLDYRRLASVTEGVMNLILTAP